MRKAMRLSLESSSQDNDNENNSNARAIQSNNKRKSPSNLGRESRVRTSTKMNRIKQQLSTHHSRDTSTPTTSASCGRKEPIRLGNKVKCSKQSTSKLPSPLPALKSPVLPRTKSSPSVAAITTKNQGKLSIIQSISVEISHKTYIPRLMSVIPYMIVI